MSDDALNAEIVDALRQIAATRELLAAALLGAVRILARDVLAVADVAPGDPLRGMIVRGARQRAERVLRDIGDDERAN
jgi:hypothetical protein